MAIGSTNYPQPVQVNGFLCRSCTDVDNAKKHIDPAHPKSGPYGINAVSDPSNPQGFIQFSGSLSGTEVATGGSRRSAGQLVDIQA